MGPSVRRIWGEARHLGRYGILAIGEIGDVSCRLLSPIAVCCIQPTIYMRRSLLMMKFCLLTPNGSNKTADFVVVVLIKALPDHQVLSAVPTPLTAQYRMDFVVVVLFNALQYRLYG